MTTGNPTCTGAHLIVLITRENKRVGKGESIGEGKKQVFTEQVHIIPQFMLLLLSQCTVEI